MNFTLSSLNNVLLQMPRCNSAMVGFSGGMDSVVLLHSLAQLRSSGHLNFQLRAIHVNHGLNQKADAWQQHCELICQELAVELVCAKVHVERSDSGNDRSSENAARSARYRAFVQHLGANEVLLSAHHRDDQVETLLLRLNRGAGSRGLAGIPRSRPLAESFLYRPLLEFDRSELQRYAQRQKLHWIEDDSNEDLRFRRAGPRSRLRRTAMATCCAARRRRWARVHAMCCR